MGTVVSYSIREATTAVATATEPVGVGAAADAAPGAAVAAAALDRAVAKLEWVDQVFSTYRPDSPISRLRRGRLPLAAAPPEVAEVLDLCRVARDASGGWFDPWALRGGVDPTGLVKGWAVERALDEFKAAGVPAAMINAGGDIAVYGEPEDGASWRIGVRDPGDPWRLLCVIEIDGPGAVATSGAYERGAHVVEPASGRPAHGLLSATVIGPDLAFADALATGLFASGGKALSSIARWAGYHAFVIDEMGVPRATPRFPLALTLAA
jgi:thiamine biosynthesis lipoprotein